jgi:PAS domain S-box-containing protein
VGALLAADSHSVLAKTLLLAGAVLVAVGAFSTQFWLLRPLEQLRGYAKDLLRRDFRQSAASAAKGEFGELAGSLTGLGSALREAETKLEQETAQRKKAEASLRELEERYVLAIDRSNDGVWELDIKTGGIEFSPRWRGMLGYLEAQRPATFEEWKQLVHSDDHEAVVMRLTNHLQGLTPQFNAEFRLRDRDNRYRWVHSRASAIRHASGKPYRVVGMDTDVHERKQLEEALIAAAEGLSSVSGEEFFHGLMRTLSTVLGTRDNLVCYCVDDPPTRAHTLAYYANGKFAEENFEYELAGTSCGAVIDRKEIVYCPTGVCDVWPAEKQYDRDSYLGVPMFDSDGKIIGHFACMDGKPMQQDLPHLAIFKIFSVRAAAELERTLLKRKLEAS